MAKKVVRLSTASWNGVKIEPLLMNKIRSICAGRFQKITPVVNDILQKWADQQDSQAEKVR